MSFYKSAIDSSPIGYAYQRVVLDQNHYPFDYEFLEVNLAFERIAMVEKAKIVGKRVSEILPKYSEFNFIHLAAEVAINGKRKEFDHYAESSKKWYRVILFSPEKYYFITQFSDITESKKNEQQLKEKNENLKKLLNTVPSAVYTVDDQKRITSWNKRAELLTGYAASEIIGKPCTLFAREPCTEKCGLLLNTVTKPVLNKVCAIKTKAGEVLQVSKNVDVIDDQYGNIIGGIECFEDITAKLKIANEIRESRENFSNFFNATDDMFVVATVKGKILFMNQAFSRNLGYQPDELLDKHVLDVHPNEYRDDAERIFGEMFQGLLDFCPLPLQKKDGSFLPVETRCWFGKWNGEECMFGISKDLSKQHAALEKFHKLFDSNPSPMALSSLPERKFMEVNGAFLKVLGYAREDIIGKTNEEIGLFVDSGKQKKVSDLLRRQGEIRDIELELRKNNGEIITGLFSGEMIDNQLEKSFLTVMIDVTEKKLAEQKLTLAKDEAEAANIAKSLFLANMSHEIRTPMNGIFGFLELLQNSELTVEQKECVREAKSATTMLLGIINDILDFSKIEAGKMSLENIPFNLHKTIEDTLSLFRHKGVEKGVQLFSNINKNVPETVVGDQVRLQQIINNLVSNAMKFTERGFVEVKVDCVVAENEIAVLQFAVRDTGIGISEDNISKLFNSFTQADESTTRKFGGTGLGLAISKELAEMMDGDIEVKSTLGEGSVFRFHVRMKIAEKGKIIKEKLQHSIITKENGLKPKLLLVEDNEANCKLMVAMLKNNGLICDIAKNGRAAFEAVKIKDYDIILMDCQMPEMDGYESTSKIREYEEDRRHAFIIAMTANAMESDRKKCLDAGMDDYLSKPVDYQLMFNMIKTNTNIQEQTENIYEPSEVHIQRLVNNTGLCKSDADEIFELFENQLPFFFQDIEKSLNRNEFEQIENMAHQLKGIAGNLCSDLGFELSVKLEESAKMGEKEACLKILDEWKMFYHAL